MVQVEYGVVLSLLLLLLLLLLVLLARKVIIAQEPIHYSPLDVSIPVQINGPHYLRQAQRSKRRRIRSGEEGCFSGQAWSWCRPSIQRLQIT